MGKIVLGIGVGVGAILIAWAINQMSWVTDLTAALGLASSVLGFFGVTIGLGTIGNSASKARYDLTAVTWSDAQVPGLIAIVGAILLAVH